MLDSCLSLSTKKRTPEGVRRFAVRNFFYRPGPVGDVLPLGLVDPGLDVPGFVEPGVVVPGLLVPGFEPGLEVPGFVEPFGLAEGDGIVPPFGLSLGIVPVFGFDGFDPGVAPGFVAPGVLEVPALGLVGFEPG